MAFEVKDCGTATAYGAYLDTATEDPKKETPFSRLRAAIDHLYMVQGQIGVMADRFVGPMPAADKPKDKTNLSRGGLLGDVLEAAENIEEIAARMRANIARITEHL